jgi:small conductance mechanosensitive channel
MQKYIDQIIELAIQYAPKVLLALITLVVGFWIIKRIVKLLKKTLEKYDIDPTVEPFLVSLASVGLKILLIFSVAGMFGVETTSFIAVMSALALSVGLALQGSLGHFASGVLLLIFKPYKVGDVVEISGKTGEVESIQIFNTVLKTFDNKRVIIPNGVVTSDAITNITGQTTRRVDIVFGIGYTSSIDKARETILAVAAKNDLFHLDPKPEVFVKELADNSVNLVFRAWTESEHYWTLFFFMQEHVKKAFDTENIEIPFPQRTVHLVK